MIKRGVYFPLDIEEKKRRFVSLGILSILMGISQLFEFIVKVRDADAIIIDGSLEIELHLLSLAIFWFINGIKCISVLRKGKGK